MGRSTRLTSFLAVALAIGWAEDVRAQGDRSAEEVCRTFSLGQGSGSAYARARHLSRGLSQFYGGELTRAVRSFHSATTVRGSALIHFDRGVTLEHLGRTREARRAYGRALSDGELGAFWRERIEARLSPAAGTGLPYPSSAPLEALLERQGRVAEEALAARDLRRALSAQLLLYCVRPRADRLYRVALTLLASGRRAEGLALLEEALSDGGAPRPELRSRVAQLRAWQSECGTDFGEGLSSAAERAYRRGFMDLGFAPRRAREAFSRAYCLSGDPSQLLNLALSEERLSSYADAARTYERYLALRPDEGPMREDVRRRLERLQDGDRPRMSRTVHMEHLRGVGLLTRAREALQSGDALGASRALRRFVRQVPDPLTQRDLARLLTRSAQSTERNAEAREAWRATERFVVAAQRRVLPGGRRCTAVLDGILTAVRAEARQEQASPSRRCGAAPTLPEAGDSYLCESGRRPSGGHCCPVGTRWDASARRCEGELRCPSGTIREDGRCEPAEAQMAFEQARCDAGDSASPTYCMTLAARHEHGLGVPEERPRAIEEYQRLCAGGHGPACLAASRLILEGRPSRRQRLAAERILEAAHRRGMRQASLMLTDLFSRTGRRARGIQILRGLCEGSRDSPEVLDCIRLPEWIRTLRPTVPRNAEALDWYEHICRSEHARADPARTDDVRRTCIAGARFALRLWGPSTPPDLRPRPFAELRPVAYRMYARALTLGSSEAAPADGDASMRVPELSRRLAELEAR